MAEIQQVAVTIRFMASDFDPEEITQALGKP